MALYCCIGVTLSSRLSNSYYNKFLGCLARKAAMKHTSSMNISKELEIISNRLTNDPSGSSIGKGDSGKSSNGSKYVQSFEEMIRLRKNEARKSIIVQVQGPQMYESLRNYCMDYGIIKNMFHYQKGFSQHFFIIEFEHQKVINNILSSAMFIEKDIGVPVKTTMLWYRNKSVRIERATGQSNEYFSTILNDEELTKKNVISVLQRSDRVSDQILDLYNTLKLNEIDIRLRFYITALIEKCFNGVLQNSTVMPFGSSVNGFGMRNCDLDLAILVPHEHIDARNANLVYYTKGGYLDPKQEIKNFLSTVATVVSYFIPGICDVYRILDARVPIIKFKHDYTATECDLSATNESGVYMSELLWLCGQISPPLRPLGCTIRKWAEAQQLTNHSPGRWISNFSLSLLILFYLQQKNMLPSLKKLKSMASSDDVRRTRDDVDFTFLRNPHKAMLHDNVKLSGGSLAKLLHGFFAYYGDFDFETSAISVLEGKVVKKCDLAPMYICNPFETHLNVSKNVNQHELNRIKASIQEACITFRSHTDAERCDLMTLLRINNSKTGREATPTARETKTAAKAALEQRNATTRTEPKNLP